MITIQHLHAYKKLSEKGIVPALVCPVDVLHTEVVPWMDEENPCLWCMYCDAKIHLGINKQKYIMELLGQ